MNKQCDIGMIGLGVMGLNFALNMADHGYCVAGFDRDKSKVTAAKQAQVHSGAIRCTDNLVECISWLKQPRAIMMLVPAGPPVDQVIAELIPLFQAGDIIIDGGNSYYKDTDVRSTKLTQQGIHFLGIGISGGEEGARYGPSMMPGGQKEAYEKIAPILVAAAAKVDGEPCIAYLGPKSAGHFVKMVHNGIEYGIMQLISETYDLMKRGLGLNNDQLSEIYASWNKGELESYLIEITSQIFKMRDPLTGGKLIDAILDVAKQNGTGMWTTQSAMELKVPTPTIDMAVNVRHLSMQEEVRRMGSQVLSRPFDARLGNPQVFVDQLSHALQAAIMMVYAQGFAILQTASSKLNYHLNLDSIATIWKGGCIIRSAFLNDIRIAYLQKDLPHLLFDARLSKTVMQQEEALRTVVQAGVKTGIPLPGFASAISYLDGLRSAWLPANLIQAQRDYFGAHAYERIDAKGTFHTEWQSDLS